MIKLLIIDLNGTLLNTKEMLIKTRFNLYEGLIQKYPKRKDLILSSFRSFLNGNSMNPDILQNLKIPISKTIKREFENRFEEDINQSLKCVHGAKEFLQKTKQNGVKIVIWSNSRIPFVGDLIEKSGISQYTDFLYCVDKKPGVECSLDTKQIDTKFFLFPWNTKKPSRESLDYIIEREGVSIHEIILIGNGIDTDGLSAHESSVKFILTEWGNVSMKDQKKLDYLIKDPRQAEADLENAIANKRIAKNIVIPFAHAKDFSDILNILEIE